MQHATNRSSQIRVTVHRSQSYLSYSNNSNPMLPPCSTTLRFAPSPRRYICLHLLLASLHKIKPRTRTRTLPPASTAAQHYHRNQSAAGSSSFTHIDKQERLQQLHATHPLVDRRVSATSHNHHNTLKNCSTSSTSRRNAAYWTADNKHGITLNDKQNSPRARNIIPIHRITPLNATNTRHKPCNIYHPAHRSCNPLEQTPREQHKQQTDRTEPNVPLPTIQDIHQATADPHRISPKS